MDAQSRAESLSNEDIASALQESEQRFRAIWEAALDAMVLSTPEGDVIAVNPAYFRFFGYAPEEVLGNARLYEQTQRLAAIQERQRLASELHDTVSQELYSISLGAQNALEILDSEAPHEARASIEHVIRRAAAAIIEMRTLIFELSSETLGSDGLIVALTRHVEMLQTAYQLSIETSLREEPDIPLVSKHVLYRVAQEALHNVIKHAYASKVDLRLTLEKFALVLEVHDNGRGFDPAGHFPNHFGLLSMRERVKSIHGTISIASTPGQGTLVCVRLPLRK